MDLAWLLVALETAVAVLGAYLLSMGLKRIRDEYGRKTYVLATAAEAAAVSLAVLVHGMVAPSAHGNAIYYMFGVYLSCVGLAAILLMAIVLTRFEGRFEMLLVVTGAVFLPVLTFTGYAGFYEVIVMEVLVAGALTVPFVGKTFIDEPAAVSGTDRNGRMRIAVPLIAGFILSAVGTWLAAGDMIDELASENIFSEILTVAAVGILIAICQGAVAVYMGDRDDGALAVIVLDVCIMVNCIAVLCAAVFGSVVSMRSDMRCLACSEIYSTTL